MAASQVRRLHSIYVHISDFSFIFKYENQQEKGLAHDSRVSVKSDILLTIVLTINKLSSIKKKKIATYSGYVLLARV